MKELYKQRDEYYRKLGKLYFFHLTEGDSLRLSKEYVERLKEIRDDLEDEGNDPDYEPTPGIMQCPRCGMMIGDWCYSCPNCGLMLK